MNLEELKNILEAVLLSASCPLKIEQLQAIFETPAIPTKSELVGVLADLKNDYQQRPIELHLGAGGYRVQTRAVYKDYICRLQREKPNKYSRALLETLAIIAYRQPVTRADIESIRGVTVSTAILKTLLERNWVKVSGRRDVPGKPAEYITTKDFLDYFNLTHLDDLPELAVDNVAASDYKFLQECTDNEQ